MIIFTSRFGQKRQISYSNALSFVKWKMSAMNGMVEKIKLAHINKSFTGIQFTEKDLK